MDSLLKAIRENPLEYLPSESLTVFWDFLKGYNSRCAMEGRPHDWQCDFRKFRDWLRHHFRMRHGRALNDVSIVCSFTSNEVEAFYKYFDLLDEFIHSEGAVNHYVSPPMKKKNFIEIIKQIRENPVMLLGNASFLNCYSYLTGDERAHKDLQLPTDEGRIVFEGFKRWIEMQKSQAEQFRPWFKLISFWSGGVDCGHSTNGAFTIFYDWLDEYAKEIGKPDLFRVLVEWRGSAPDSQQRSTG